MRKEYGPRAPETKEALLRYVRKARRQGFGIVTETYTAGTNAIAAPIRHPQTQEVSGVVVVAGPSVRFTETRMEALAPALLDAARELCLTATGSPVGSRDRGRRAESLNDGQIQV